MKYLYLLLVVLSASVLFYATLDFPQWGDPNSPASLHVSPVYLQRSLEDTAVPNVVTSVLADYRGYDTMFETTVIFTAGLACFVLLRVFSPKMKDTYYRHTKSGVVLHIKAQTTFLDGSRDFERIDSRWVPADIILKTISRFLIPFIQLFALYVVA
ncbi:MAG: hydrogen gas-evolving membrane-bound hydrogenase subunit E, partial [Desulfatiglandales bacterium]